MHLQIYKQDYVLCHMSCALNLWKALVSTSRSKPEQFSLNCEIYQVSQIHGNMGVHLTFYDTMWYQWQNIFLVLQMNSKCYKQDA